jgi:hypothetical protein
MESSPSQRTTFSEKLNAIMDEVGGHVYFQPPENVKLEYPCLVYELEDINVRFADNGPYSLWDRYQVTLIRHDPDSPLIRKLMGLPHSSFSRHFATSGLNHDVFVIYHQ